MRARRDPLEYPEELIRRVYAYVAYRIGAGADAEDVTSDVFERAIRYRESFDPDRGTPLGWLIGIARRSIAEFAANAAKATHVQDSPTAGDLETDALRRLALRDALAALPEPEQELIALRYGADLTARQIAELIGVKTNAVEVRLHRALSRLREDLRDGGDGGTETRAVRNPALEQ